MSPTPAFDPDDRAQQATQRRGRGYSVAGMVVVIALALVLLVGLAGVAGPGFLSQGEAFFVLGAGVAVLAIAVVGLFFSLRRTLSVVRGQQATIDHLQEMQLRATEEEQRRTDRAQDEELAHLRSTMEDRILQMEAEIARLQHRVPAVADPGLPQATPFGDIHPVIDVEGIGETFEAQLEELNILDTEQLWTAEPSAVAQELNIPEKTVRGWQAMAELMALEHVGPQYAELLVRAGITSIQELASMEPAEVHRTVQQTEEAREVRIQGTPISEKHTEKWVQAAREHDPKAMRVRR